MTSFHLKQLSLPPQTELIQNKLKKVFGVRILSWSPFRKGVFSQEGTTYSSLKGSQISHTVIPLMYPRGPLFPSFSPTTSCISSFPLLGPSEPLIFYCSSLYWYTLLLSCKPRCFSVVSRLNSSARRMQGPGKPARSPGQTAAKCLSEDLELGTSLLAQPQDLSRPRNRFL